MLIRQYRRKEIFRFTGNVASDIKRFQLLPEDKRKNIELFIGHAPIIVGLPEADNIPIITLLRDPIKRVKSFCQYVSEGKSPYLAEAYSPESFGLDDFLKSGDEELSNLQTKMLIKQGGGALAPIIYGMSELEARDRALESLSKKIFCFGLQEYFDESLIIFANKLNWKKTLVYSSVNKKNYKHLLEFKERHIEQIAELNTIDIEVYKAAREKFLNVVNSEWFNTAKLRKLKRVQPWASPWIRVIQLTRRCAGRLFRFDL